jgi:hypothetical protein
VRVKVLISGISIVLSTTALAQPGRARIDLSKVPVLQSHYQAEYTYDRPSDTLLWAGQKSGLHAAFFTTDELYPRSEVPLVSQEPLIWEPTGWRGERLNAQILVWSADTIEQIRFSICDLVNTNGYSISKNNIKLNMVRYVVSNFPYGAKNFGCDSPTDSAWLMPDRLETFERFDLPGRTVRPVWMTIEIPGTSEQGVYKTILKSILQMTNCLKVNITVQELVLPDPHKWKFRLDLWQNPWVTASTLSGTMVRRTQSIIEEAFEIICPGRREIYYHLCGSFTMVR